MTVLTKAILQAARAKIEDPDNWSKGSFFRYRGGTEAYSLGPGVTCMCAAGALAAAIDEARQEPCPQLALVSTKFQHAWIELNSLASRHTKGMLNTVQELNDQGQHPDVLRFYDFAIEETNP